MKKNHIKEFGGRNAPETSPKNLRTSRDTRDVWADLCGNPNSRGRKSAGQTGHMTGQTGHVHGTDGTHTHTPGGVPPKNSLCLLVFFLSRLKPTPATCHKAKTEVALQFSECCAAEVALQHWHFCIADVILTKSCAAASEKLQCNIKKLRCREVALSCRFPVDFKPPRSGTHV